MVTRHRLAKSVGKDCERICGACDGELDVNSMNQWIHASNTMAFCKNKTTGAMSWAYPRAISYERFVENGYTYDNIHNNEEKRAK